MKFILVWISLVLSVWGSIGDVAALRGEATLERQKVVSPLKAGMELLEGDVITTQERTRVQVILKDETVVTIGANATFAFDRFVFKGSENPEVSLHAKRGFFRTLTGEIAKKAPERFEVKTVSATIGIRGTDFSGEIFADKEIIRCFSGAIFVDFEGKIHEVDAGMLIELSFENVHIEEMAEHKPQNDSFFQAPREEILEQDTLLEDLSDINQIISEEPHESHEQYYYDIGY